MNLLEIAFLWIGQTAACVPGQYQSAEECLDCSSNCISCLSDLKCIECNSHFFLSQDSCSRCPDNCEVCSPTDCTLCSPGFALVDFQCVDCSTDGWLEIDGECAACPATCRTCNSTLSCDSCPEHAHLGFTECICDESQQGFYYAQKFVEQRGKEGLSLECRATECYPACQTCFGSSAAECITFKCTAGEMWSEFSKECVSHCSNFETAQGNLCLFDYSLRQSEQFRGELVVLVILASSYIIVCVRLVRVSSLEPELLLTLMVTLAGILNYASDLMLLFTLQGFYKQLATLCVLFSRIVQSGLGVLCVKYIGRKDDLFRDWLSGEMYHTTGGSCKTMLLACLASVNALPLATFEYKWEGLTAHCRHETTMKSMRRLGWAVSLVTAFIENPVMSVAIIEYIRQEMFPGWFLVFSLMVNWLCMVRLLPYLLMQQERKEFKELT